MQTDTQEEEALITVVQTLEPTLDYGGELSKRIAGYAARYDLAIFDVIQRATESMYDGGSWEMRILSNGAWYINWITDIERVPLVNPANYTHKQASPEAASIAVNLVVQNQIIWHAHGNNKEKTQTLVTEYFYALREAAAQHDEATAIFAFID